MTQRAAAKPGGGMVSVRRDDLAACLDHAISDLKRGMWSTVISGEQPKPPPEWLDRLRAALPMIDRDVERIVESCARGGAGSMSLQPVPTDPVERAARWLCGSPCKRHGEVDNCEAKRDLAAALAAARAEERARWMPIHRSPLAVRMDMLNEEWAQHNHGQSLSHLAERGGLDPSEILAIIERRPWSQMTSMVALDLIRARAQEGE